MKLRLLLFAVFLTVGIINAQEAYRNLIITESHAFRADESYLEITNMGNIPVQLANFRIGKISPWEVPYNSGQEIHLPNKILEPGKSFVIATVYDYNEKMYPLFPDKFNERVTQKEYWEFADLQIHISESNPAGAPNDSVSVNNGVMGVWNGREGWYIEQILSDVDSVIIDQVGGVFDDNGRNFGTAYDVAGVTGATGNSILVRKFSIKQGNLDFANARGVGEDDSEWMVIPLPYNDWHPWRSAYWTPGNHGDFKLNESTLSSKTLKVDWNSKTITAPWGVRNLDNFVKEFDKKPGLAWFYHLSPNRVDSAFASARTGDKITIYACGSKLERETFNIVVNEPTKSDNIVMPKYRTGANGFYGNIITGRSELFLVTEGQAVMDTITNSLFGIPYATRVDTLFKYLEKAPKASWEIEWIDGITRPDLKNGDILKVTAENGDVKKYFIKVNQIRPNHNAYLSAITWPDIPDYLKGLFGWKGDTIPNFVSTGFNYTLQVPTEINSIPALVAKPQMANSKVKVERATSLNGSKEQRTIKFIVTAEDGTTQYTYSVELFKELDPQNVQPFVAEPFLSELVFQDMWSNGFVEICNPGSMVLDLSRYMMVFDWSASPAAAIRGWSAANQWPQRYNKYVPGYKWVNEASWLVTPGILEKDLNVNALVYPGEVFVGGHINADWGWNSQFPKPKCDVVLNSPHNPWKESYTEWASAVHQWVGADFYLFKILNDSILAGLKPANDPNDFELIEVFGMGDGSAWNIGGYSGMGGPQCMTFIRKPEFWKGKNNYKASFGTNEDDTEWLRYDPAYWERNGTGWPGNILNDTKDLGKHFMHTVTDYKSTVSSVVYKVSEGYSLKESIKGITTGTTAEAFKGNIIKANEKQTLTIKRGDVIIDGANALMANDTLVVLSADAANTTKYLLSVTNEGLSSNAVLTSARYTITIEKQPKSATGAEAGTGNIKGFDYGTSLRTILANIKTPEGATLEIIDKEGAYVPLKILNYDTTYVQVGVNSNIYLNVTAENGITQIVYQLIPSSSENDAFILSDVYNVSQKDLLIELVPRGTNVSSFLERIYPVAGATVKLLNKMGQERKDGYVADDDKVAVTSANGLFTKTYYISRLAERYIPESTYLAYILSPVYSIDQVSYKIAGVAGDEPVVSFMSKITIAKGATAVVIDKNGNIKNSGDIDSADRVEVTSADGKIKVYYTFGPLTSNGSFTENKIEIYPNPTNNILYVSGVKPGCNILVYNAVGVVISNIVANSNIERISLGNQPAGLYMVIVNDNNNLIGRFKALKK